MVNDRNFRSFLLNETEAHAWAKTMFWPAFLFFYGGYVTE